MGNKSSTEASEIPTKMKRIVLVESHEDLNKAKFEVQECDVPVPKSGEVLVRVNSAPVNPSDYGSWRNAKEPNTLYLGKEGSGVVVKSGGGMQANGLVGKNVGIVNMKDGGSYQEYVCVSAMTGCFALPDDVKVEDACSFFVNPYTAVGIVATARELKSPGFVHTAAASQLGQMLVKLCSRADQKMTLINVVRREEQAETLKALGAEHIIVSSKEGWKDELAKLVEEKKITCAFDCIGGESTGDMVDVMPKGGTTFVYGGLSEKPVSGIKVMDLIYRRKKVEGWLLTNWVQGSSAGQMGNLMRLNNASKLVLPGLAKGWAASQFVDVKPEDMWSKFLEMRTSAGFTNQKLRIRWPVPEPKAPAAPQSAGSQFDSHAVDPLTDNVVTLAPYFKLKDAAKFKSIWQEDYKKFAHKEDCTHYAFCFTDDDRAHCREAYPNAEKVLQHLADVDSPFKAVLDGPAELERLEVHGPKAEVDKLREALGPLGCLFYVSEWGFRTAKPTMDDDTVCHLYPYFKLKQPDQFRKIWYDAYPDTKANAEAEKSHQYAFSFEPTADVASCRESYGDADGILLHLKNVDTPLKAVLDGPAELLRLEVHAPAAEIEKLKPALSPLGCQFFATGWGFRNAVAPCS